MIVGSLELDLRQLVAPAKTPEKCSLAMLDDVEIGSPSKNDTAKCLFAQQSVRGWWPCYMEKDGKKELGVGAKNDLKTYYFLSYSLYIDHYDSQKFDQFCLHLLCNDKKNLSIEEFDLVVLFPVFFFLWHDYLVGKSGDDTGDCK